MDRAQAVEALELLRRVVGQARDDTTLQNWGVIWMLHGFTNGLGFDRHQHPHVARLRDALAAT